ncbi:MarR family winged helix-turn-helix transcriptional regulator [Chachezhania sediminis]|uniref:MarR family winged helix-turn-helix transcriptional regulator n=1 Tax=Chachezhania sediminis TaxID=2599291 RepID=UPI001E50C227|nr:MarR family transcriptional regulator [Chachezhania sediminis]
MQDRHKAAVRATSADMSEGGADTDDIMRSFIGYSLKRAYLVVHRVAQGALQPFDLKIRSFSALSLIVGRPGITLTELAEVLQVERSNLVLIMDELEQRDLIARVRDPKDRRRYSLHATIRGRRLLEKASAATSAEEGRLTANLTDDELDTLLKLLRKLETGA